MTSIRTASIRIVIAAALAAGAALAGVAATHHTDGSDQRSAVTTVVRPAGIVDCCV